MPDKMITIPSRVWGLSKFATLLFFICVIVGSMIAFFSPTVTFMLGPDERLEFWLILCLVGGCGILACKLMLDFMSLNFGRVGNAFLKTVFGSVAVLIPVFSIYGPEDLPGIDGTILFVWSVMVLIVAGTLIVERQAPKDDVPLSEPVNSVDIQPDAKMQPKAIDEPSAPAIMSRLPLTLRDSQLLALSAEDHYVRVHSSKGEALILLRLSDAILETTPAQGLQTHRSWWVAKAAIKDIQTQGRTAEIMLTNGSKASVSRNGMKTLKEHGWL